MRTHIKSVLRIIIILLMSFAYLLAPAVTAQANEHVNESANKTVHIIVVLADNANQGIVPVPDKLGDGMNPRTNLYWGALYGVKTHFRRQNSITTLPSKNTPLPKNVLEQIDFLLKTENGNISIHAEAWRGDRMAAAIRSFYDNINKPDGSGLVVFVGHNGLMDTFVPAPLPLSGQPKYGKNKDAMILACFSDRYFTPTLNNLGARPALMTQGLMAPEAYSLLPAIKAWAAEKPVNDIRKSAAAGYAKYQKIPLRNAERLFGVKK